MSNLNELRKLIDLIKHLGGLTQAAIAEKAGYERTYLSQALKMKKPPEKLITKLNLTFSDILTQEVPSKKQGKESPKNGLRNEFSDFTDMTTMTMKPTFGEKPGVKVTIEELQKRIIQLEAEKKTLQEMIDKLLQKR